MLFRAKDNHRECCFSFNEPNSLENETFKLITRRKTERKTGLEQVLDNLNHDA